MVGLWTGRHVQGGQFTLLLALLALTPEPATAQQPGWPCAGTVDPSYVRASEATGGKVLLLKPTEIAGTGTEVAAWDRHEETILRAGGSVEEGAHDFDVPVDSTVESVYFFVSMQCLQDATITKPSGAALDVNEPGIQYHHFDALRLFVVPKPEAGIWHVKTSGRGLLSLIVKARSDLRLGAVRFVADGVTLVAESTLGRRLRIDATVSGGAQDVAFQFVGREARALAPAGLTLIGDSGRSRSYSGEVDTPTSDFRLAITGSDANGFAFQRVDERLSIALTP